MPLAIEDGGNDELVIFMQLVDARTSAQLAGSGDRAAKGKRSSDATDVVQQRFFLLR